MGSYHRGGTFTKLFWLSPIDDSTISYEPRNAVVRLQRQFFA